LWSPKRVFTITAFRSSEVTFTLLLPKAQSGMAVDWVSQSGIDVVIHVHSLATTARCPDCGKPSSCVHGRYIRRPLDSPWQGHTVHLSITVRRFRCSNDACFRKTFSECLPSLPRYAHRTVKVSELLIQVSTLAGGEAGARLARHLGIPTSPDTLLRLLRHRASSDQGPVYAIGVDDLALRKGRVYATLIVNLEREPPANRAPQG
jgi:transposase